jgi:nucleoside-diphosphate-sugar epimerase
MRILTTGGSGYIGSRLVKKLLEQEHDVVVFDNFSTGKRENLELHNNLFVFDQDLKDADGLKVLIRSLSPFDIVFHLAASASVPESIKYPQKFWENNVTATSNLLNAIDLKHSKLIFASSSSVYGDKAKKNVKESDADNSHQLSPYAFTKITGERLIEMYHRIYGLKYNILRFFNVYDGEGFGRGVIDQWVREKKQGIKSVQFGNVARDFTHVNNIVHGLIASMDSGGVIGGAYNIGEGHCICLDRIAEILDVDTEWTSWKSCDVKECSADITKAKDFLGYQPLSYWVGKE